MNIMNSHKKNNAWLPLLLTTCLVVFIVPVEGQCGGVPPYMEGWCPQTFEPVSCSGGSVMCSYQNECYAFVAGANLATCTEIALTPSNRCPVARSTSCPLIFEPVFCLLFGTEFCEYGNQCTADAAFRSSGVQGQCFGNNWNVCPAIPSTSCTMEFEPVYCTVVGTTVDCLFPNQCLANAACRGNICICQPNSCPNSNCNPNANQVPFLCGVGQRDMPRDPAACWYASQRCFETAGFTINQCCRQPRPSDVQRCGTRYNPAVCGNKDCIYDNRCLAEAAGFNFDNQCGRCNPNCLDTCTSPNSQNVGQGQRPRTCRGASTSSSNAFSGGNGTVTNGTQLGMTPSMASGAAGILDIIATRISIMIGMHLLLQLVL